MLQNWLDSPQLLSVRARIHSFQRTCSNQDEKKSICGARRSREWTRSPLMPAVVSPLRLKGVFCTSYASMHRWIKFLRSPLPMSVVSICSSIFGERRHCCELARCMICSVGSVRTLRQFSTRTRAPFCSGHHLLVLGRMELVRVVAECFGVSLKPEQP